MRGRWIFEDNGVIYYECTFCHACKPADAFHKRAGGSKIRAQCKTCVAGIKATRNYPSQTAKAKRDRYNNDPEYRERVLRNNEKYFSKKTKEERAILYKKAIWRRILKKLGKKSPKSDTE